MSDATALPFRWPKLLIFAVLISALFTVAGCGSSASDFIATSHTGLTTQPVVGKVYVGKTLGGVEVSILAPDGQTVATARTDSSGTFFIPQTLPVDFLAQARVAEDLLLLREVRGYGGELLVLNGLSTMVALQARSTGSSLEDATVDIRGRLKIAESDYLDMMEESPSRSFSHVAFLAESAAVGGPQAYLEQLSSGATPPQAPFIIRREHLQADFSSLSPELQAILSDVLDDPKLQLALRSRWSRALDRQFTLNGEQVAVEERAETAQAILGGVENIIEYIGVSAESEFVPNGSDLDKVFSWVGVALGWRNADTDALEAIQEQLVQVQQGISDIDLKTDQGTFDAANSNVQTDYIKPITDIIDDELDAIAQADPKDNNDRPSSTPSIANQNIANYVSFVNTDANFDEVHEDLKGIQAAMVGLGPQAVDGVYGPPEPGSGGTTNLTTFGAKLNVQQTLGVPIGKDGSQSGKTGFTPVRSSYLFDQALQTFEYYASYQIFGMTALGETGHGGSQPSVSISQLILRQNNAVGCLLAQRAQLPHYPQSDKFFIDLQNGLIWYTEVQSARTFSSANSVASSFSAGPYGAGTWRIPAYQEIQSLQQRGAYAMVSDGELDTEDTVDGLAALGFDNTEAIDDAGSVWAYAWVYDDNTWKLDDKSLRADLNQSIIPYQYIHEEDDTYPFFLVHSIGDPVLAMDVPGGSDGSGWPSALTSKMKASEMPYLGVPTGIGMTIDSFSDLAPVADWKVYLGGTVELGTDTIKTSYTTARVANYGVSGYSSVLPIVWYTTADHKKALVSNFPDDYGAVYENADSGTSVALSISGLTVDEERVSSDQDGNNTLAANAFPFIGTASPIYTNRHILSSTPNHTVASPQNLTLDLTTASGKVGQNFVATGFYNGSFNRFVVDRTADVDWHAHDETTNTEVPGITFSQSEPGRLIIDLDTLSTTEPYLVLKIKGAGTDVYLRLNLN